MNYLTPSQNYTLNSAKTLKEPDFFEVNYTADYKLDEFIDEITAKNIEYGEDMRYLLKDLIAPASNIVPDRALLNVAPGCSSVVAQDKDSGAWLLGRNYDFDIGSNGTYVVVHTAPDNGYKSVGVADMSIFGLSKNELDTNKELLLYSPYVTMDGVNEKGFAVSLMLLDQDRNVQNEPNKASMPSSLIVRYLLDNADSVDNAISLLNNFNLKPDYYIYDKYLQDVIGEHITLHWAMVDESGNRAVVEYVNGQMNVLKNPVQVDFNEQNGDKAISYPNEPKPYLIATNFFLSQGVEPDVLASGFWRYSTLKEQLENNPTPNKDELAKMMQSVKFLQNDKDTIVAMQKQGLDPNDASNWGWLTLWTDVLDTKEKSMQLYFKEDYNEEYNFEVEAGNSAAMDAVYAIHNVFENYGSKVNAAFVTLLANDGGIF